MCSLPISLSHIRSFCLSFLFVGIIFTCVNVFTSTTSTHRSITSDYTSGFLFSSTKSKKQTLLLSSNDIHKIEWKCRSNGSPQRIKQHRIVKTNISSMNSIELKQPKEMVSNENFIPYDYEDWQSSGLMPRLVSKCEHQLMMQLLKHFDELTRKYSLEYMMTDGTLLGSWRHHDLIPWDDDIDLLMSVKLKARLNFAIELETPPSSSHFIEFYRRWDAPKQFEYYKFYFSSSAHFSEYPWRYPFVDLIFYHENQTHIWQENMQQTTSLSKQQIFPLKLRPLGSLWLPAPKSPHDYFLGVNWTKYDEICINGHWSHKYERSLPNDYDDDYKSTVNCRDLYQFYPFVERSSSNADERLIINGTIKQTLKIIDN